MGALLVVAPLAAVVVLNLLPGSWVRKPALIAAGALCAAEAIAAWTVPTAAWARIDADQIFRAGFPVDGLGRVMLLSTGIVGLCAAMIAHATFAASEAKFRFANLLLLSLAGLNGVLLVRDLLGLYVFMEITAVCSFVAIALADDKNALRAAFKYMVLSAVATSMIVSGLALVFIIAGGTGFAPVRLALQSHGHSQLLKAAVTFFLAGLAIKAGLVPFHGWVPGAYSSAPPAVSILLAGIVTKATGCYALIRLVIDVFDSPKILVPLLLAGGLASVLVGAVGALGQKDLKRMLAHSSISQMGYVVLGLAAGPGLGLCGAIFHLFNHALFESLLFTNAAAVEQQSGTRRMDQLGGIAARMPVTGATSILAMLSAAGLPPMPGFWSKLMVIAAVWKAGHPAVAAVAVGASLLTLAYFLSMQRRVFFGRLAQSCAGLREAPLRTLAPALILAAIMVAVGLAAPWLFETFLLPVRSFL